MRTKLKLFIVRTLFLFLPFLASFSAQAQNSLVVSVLPPYTNRLSDYSNSPNKVTVIVTINGMTTPNFSGNVYFRGILKNSSGDIEISTRPGSKPLTPVRIPQGPGGTPIPYRLTFDEIQSLFDWNNLNYKGITLDNVIRYGMPEDLYTLCIQTFDYDTNELLINETCSPPFNIALLEPPIIISPAQNSTLFYTDIQNVLFNWTLPPGAPLFTQYTLRVVEMMEGVNPQDALRLDHYPMRLFETTVTGNGFLYTNAAPRLEVGKKYAFAVTASTSPISSEPQGVFRNNGMSEVHTFEMEAPLTTTTGVTETDTEPVLYFVSPTEDANMTNTSYSSGFTLQWSWKALKPHDDAYDHYLYCSNNRVTKFRLEIHRAGVTSSKLIYNWSVEVNESTVKEGAHHLQITHDNAAAIGVTEGEWYRATVTALNSEGQTLYKASSVNFQYNVIPESLYFVYPNPYFNIADINYESNFKLQWNWEGLSVNAPPDSLNNLCNGLDIRKFILTINEKEGQSTSPSSYQNTPSAHHFIISQSNATAIGLTDGFWYRATVEAINSSGQVLFSAVSADFQYNNIPDPNKRVAIRGSVKYAFDGKIGGPYVAPNTPLTIEADRIDANSHVPAPIPPISVMTDDEGNFELCLAIPQPVHDGDMIALRVKSDNPYYVDYNFPEMRTLVMGDTSYVNFGLLLAQTHAYSLKLNVTKRYIFDNYQFYDHGFQADRPDYVADNIPEGIDVVLFRTQKPDEIPPIEGSMANYQPQTGTKILVSHGKTQSEFIGGIRKVFVQFDRLLASDFAADHEYWIQAVQGDISLNAPMAVWSEWSDNGFIAEKMAYRLPLPAKYHKDSLYRNVTATYEIKSTAPPQSIIKGSLTYKWESDPGGIVRPMTFTPFNIVVEYKFAPGYFYDEPMFDYGEIVGHGVTDKDGNFRIVVNNFNKKGTIEVEATPAPALEAPPDVSTGPRTIENEKTVSQNINDLNNAIKNSSKSGDGQLGTSNSSLNEMGRSNEVRDLIKAQAQNVGQAVGVGIVSYTNTNIDAVNNQIANGSVLAGIQSNLNGNTLAVPIEGGSFMVVKTTTATNTTATKTTATNTIATTTTATKTAYAQPVTPEDFSILLAETTGMGQAHGPYSPQDPLLIGNQLKTIPTPPKSVISTTGNSDPIHTTIERVFRIVPDPTYYWGAGTTFVVQPLDSITLDPQCSLVKEASITVTTKTIKKGEEEPLGQTVVLVFRDPASKPTDGIPMPLGEGYGRYEIKKLMNPEYSTDENPNPLVVPYDKFQNLSVVEYIWDPTQVFKMGEDENSPYSVTLPGLLAAFGDYYVEACTENVIGATNYYAAAFESVGNLMPHLYTPKEISMVLEPLPSRILVRTQDSITTQGLPYANIRVAANEAIDKDGNIYLHRMAFSDGSGRDIHGSAPSLGITDKDGYLACPASDKITIDPINGTQVNLRAFADGYRPSGNAVQGLNRTGEQMNTKLFLMPNGTISFAVADNHSLGGVESFIRVDSANVVSTSVYGIVTLTLPAKTDTKIRVIPKDLAYFEEEFTLGELGIDPAWFQNPYPYSLNSAVKVFRKKHRIEIVVRDGEYNNLKDLEGATVSLGDTVKTVGGSGKAYFEFENVMVNNYTFVIRGKANSDFIPVVLSIKNEESRDVKTHTVSLSRGSGISGIVTLNGQPVKNAKVYLDLSQQAASGSTSAATSSGSENLIVDYTDSDGRYNLRGVPVVANNAKIDVLATLDTTFTVKGTRATATIRDKGANVNLNLERYDDMLINNLYGFPLTVEEITAGPSNKTVKVTGLIKWNDGISDFELIDNYQQLRVEDVVFEAVTKNGVTMGVPIQDLTSLSGVSSIKLQYFPGDRTYNLLLKPWAFNDIPLPIIIGRTEDNKGAIWGKMNIIENSFNYTSSYLDFTVGDNNFAYSKNFYLATMSGNTVNTNLIALSSPLNEDDWYRIAIDITNLPVTSTGEVPSATVLNPVNTGSLTINAGNAGTPGNITSAAEGTQYAQNLNTLIQNIIAQAGIPSLRPRYHLSDSKGEPLQFEFLKFPATANPQNSYIHQNGTIHLNVDLDCYIPHAQPERFSLHISEIILDGNEVRPATGDTLKIKLRDWTLEVPKWEISPEKGGIYQDNAVIRTKVVDIPVEFMLRHNLFDLKASIPETGGGLSIGGGVADVVLNPGGNAVLLWDNSAGNLFEGHWRFSIIGKDGKAPAYTKLSGMVNSVTNQEGLDIAYLEILDNNESVFQFASGQKCIFDKNPLAKVTLQSVFNGANYVDVRGALNIGAPRVPDIIFDLQYTGTSSNQKKTFKRIRLDFITKGNVHFIADTVMTDKNIVIDQNTIVIQGEVYESPLESFNNMPATLTANAKATGTNPVYDIAIKPNWTVWLQPTSSTTRVSAMAWNGSPLSGSGYYIPNAIGGTSVKNNDWELFNFKGKMITTDQSNKGLRDPEITFTVKGAVEATSNSFGVTGLGANFGNFQTVYDYKNASLIGSLKVGAPLPMGPLLITGGTVEFCADKNGFYTAGSFSTILTAPIIGGNYNLGFMIGYYPVPEVVENRLWPLVTAYTSTMVANDCYLDKIGSRLNGFYFVIDRKLFDEKIGFNFVLASFYVRGSAAVGADIYANFNNPVVAGIGVRAALSAAAGISSPVARVSAGADFKGAFDFGVSGSTVTASAALWMSLWLKIQIGIDVGLVEVWQTVADAHFDFHAYFSNHGSKFSTGAGAKKDCPSFPQKSN